jgi:hypothetical protein
MALSREEFWAVVFSVFTVMERYVMIECEMLTAVGLVTGKLLGDVALLDSLVSFFMLLAGQQQTIYNISGPDYILARSIEFNAWFLGDISQSDPRRLKTVFRVSTSTFIYTSWRACPTEKRV